jgi:response regulator NasT
MSNKVLNILLVEDDSLVMLGFKQIITRLGHNIIGEAYDGQEAIRLAAQLDPDLVIMDIKLPGVDGIRALETINSGRTKAVPCIFITAHTDNAIIERATNCGAYSYLVKPVEIDDIRAAIEVTVKRSRDYSELKEELNDTKMSLENRKYIEKAKGILCDEFGMKETEAMSALQRKSKNNNIRLVDVAKDIIKKHESGK